MLLKKTAILILGLVMTLSSGLSAYAADRFPFGITLDTEEIPRLCYSEHSSAVKYREGVAILPESCFAIEDLSSASDGYDINELSAVIGLKYEREDGTGSMVEILRTYAPGSFTEGEYYPFLSDNIIANLEERGLLYSDGLRSLYITLKCPGRGQKSQVTYLYVAEEDEFYEYLTEAPGEEPDDEGL